MGKREFVVIYRVELISGYIGTPNVFFAETSYFLIAIPGTPTSDEEWDIAFEVLRDFRPKPDAVREIKDPHSGTISQTKYWKSDIRAMSKPLDMNAKPNFSPLKISSNALFFKTLQDMQGYMEGINHADTASGPINVIIARL